jgi:hypothetical protein
MEAKRARLIKNVIQAVVVIGIGALVRVKTAETHAPVWIAAGWLLSAWVVLRLAIALRRGYAKFRTHTATGINLDNIDKLTAASMQPWARGYYQMETRVYREAWRALRREPLAPAGDFSVAAGPKAEMRSAVLLLLVLACAVAAGMILPGIVTAFWPRVFTFAGAGFALLYALIWIVGERRSVAEGGHRLTRDELILDLGIRGAGAVALASIAACRVLEAGAHAGSAGDVWTLSPGERTNVLIELTGMTTLAVTSFGSPRAVTRRFIALYVDQPDAFAAAVLRAASGGKRAAIA